MQTRGILRSVLVGVGALLVGAASPGGAAAEEVFAIQSFSTAVVTEDGSDEARAGAHPFGASADISFETYPRPWSGDVNRRGPAEEPRNVEMRLPAGFVGNPRAAGRCPLYEVKTQPLGSDRSPCPMTAAVGRMVIDGNVSLSQPIFNVEPEPGYPAQFAFSHQSFTFVLYPELRSDGDYGINIASINSPVNLIRRIRAELCSWGVVETSPPGSTSPTYACRKRVDAPADARPFLTMSSTECPAEAPVTTLRVNSWANPGRYIESQFASPPLTDCDTLTFEPTVDIGPTTTLPDAPSGLNVEMAFPQEDNEHGQAPPALKKAVVTMPEGMTISPSGAGGLAACADGELLLKSKDPMTCPDASKIGEVVATSPLLDEEIKGGVYIRSQNSSDPESGEMFRLALVLQNKDRGIDVRLPGQVRINRATGRIETTFDNNPELPVESLKLNFKDGPRAPLATPTTCGPHTIDTVLTSWGKQTKHLQSTFTVDCLPGLGSFGPGFNAGTMNPVAGASSPFNLLMTRADGHDVINRLTLKMPEGLLANLKGNVGTQIGTVTADAGPGSHPYRFPGRVYLEGPYGDAPFSLKVVIPAKAGPFDLGEVVVKQKIHVDPTTAAVTVVSDPIPTIVEGVPVRLRNMSVDVDKAGFMINPTSCAEKRIDATASSLHGQSANVASRFQVGECDKLPVRPRMQIDVVGSKQLSYHKHPGIKATVTQAPGEAGLRRVEVAMPLSLALDPDNAKALCEPAQAEAKACPEASIVGDATAISPVLNRPLTGKVYFVKGTRVTETGRIVATLPKLWVALRGEVALDVWADSDVKNRRLVSTFARVPDAPIESFELNIYGGSNGILQVTGQEGAHMCNQRNVADARFDGQNGRRFLSATHMNAPCAFRAVSSTLESKDARVRLTGLGAGRITVSGNGVRTTRRTIKQSPLATVRARLTASGQRTRRLGRSVRVKVTFQPTGGGKARTTTVTVKPPAKKSSARGGGSR